MTLSADILNQRSPYKLSQLGEFTFRFVTDQISRIAKKASET